MTQGTINVIVPWTTLNCTLGQPLYLEPSNVDKSGIKKL